MSTNYNVGDLILKEKGILLLDCFNPNIQYIVESEKEQKVIAEYYAQVWRF